MRRLRGHLRRPRPSSIVITIAFFLATGGVGYAVIGSGTLQKENEIGLPGSTNPGVVDAEVIRTIAGVGSIEVFCDTDDDLVYVGVRNKSGEPLQVGIDTGDQLSFHTNLANNSGAFASYSNDEILQVHFSPADGTKAPQADVTVSVDNTGDCNTSQVAVINVTTTSSGSGTVAGSGTVQKGALKGLGSLGVLVRSVTGVGEIYARCNNNNPDQPLFDFENTSGEAVRVFAEEVTPSSGSFSATDLNNNVGQTYAGNGDTLTKLYVFPADGSKTPQADITVSIADTNDCTDSAVSVLSVTTQE
jgi:hypothetical protein